MIVACFQENDVDPIFLTLVLSLESPFCRGIEYTCVFDLAEGTTTTAMR